MRNAYILHGCCDKQEYFEMDFPSPSNAHWLPWLQQKFLRAGILCQCLEMPTPYKAIYEEWKAVWQKVALKQDTIIVGHSAGCGFILKWLSENPNIRIAKLVMVAPWFDLNRERGNFLKFDLKYNLENSVDNLHVFYSENEKVDGVAKTKDLILKTLPKTNFHLFKSHGHFCLSDMGTAQFPELWETVRP